MKIFKTLLALFFILSTEKIFACINYYIIDSAGHNHFYEHEPPSHIHNSTKYNIEKLNWLEKEIPLKTAEEKYKYLSDYYALAIKLGHYKEAIPAFEKLVAAYPDEYSINANLAVAYELNGQLEKALLYLKKAIALDNTSHENSEWIHQQYLETGIAIQKKLLRSNEATVLTPDSLKNFNTGYQISYQLRERIPLTASPDSLLSKLLTQCGDFYFKTISIEFAIDLYAIAAAYSSDSTTKALLWQKIESARTYLIKVSKGKRQSSFKYLYSNKWRTSVKKLIETWTNYKPYYYKGEIKTSF